MKAAKRKRIVLPLATEIQIDPAVAAIRAARLAGPLTGPANTLRRGPLLSDELRVEPEIRQAHLAYELRPDELADMSLDEYQRTSWDRARVAREASNRRLYGEHHRDLIAAAERTAIEAALSRTTGAESVAAVRSILATHTRESVREGIAESERERRAKGGQKRAVASKREAAARAATLFAADDALLRENPGAKAEWRAAIHSERGFGGRVAIYRILLRRGK